MPDASGAAFVSEGGPEGIGTRSNNLEDRTLDEGDLFSGFGSSVAGAGGVDSNGHADVIAGAAGEVREGYTGQLRPRDCPEV